MTKSVLFFITFFLIYFTHKSKRPDQFLQGHVNGRHLLLHQTLGRARWANIPSRFRHHSDQLGDIRPGFTAHFNAADHSWQTVLVCVDDAHKTQPDFSLEVFEEIRRRFRGFNFVQMRPDDYHRRTRRSRLLSPKNQNVKKWRDSDEIKFRKMETNRIVSYRIVSYRNVSCRIVPYHNVSYRIATYRVVSYRIITYRIVSQRIVSYHIVSYRIVPYHNVSYHNVSYRIVSYRIVSYHNVSYRTVSGHGWT